jgi:hypothetical protein
MCRRGDRQTNIGELRNILRCVIRDLGNRILFDDLRDHIVCIVIIERKNKFRFECITQFYIVRELWQQVRITYSVGKRIKEKCKWIQVLVIRPGNPPAV